MDAPEPYLTIEQVTERYGFSKGMLATMRFEKRGPDYFKPSAKIVLYKASAIDAWIEASLVQSEAKAA